MAKEFTHIPELVNLEPMNLEVLPLEEFSKFIVVSLKESAESLRKLPEETEISAFLHAALENHITNL